MDGEGSSLGEGMVETKVAAMVEGLRPGVVGAIAELRGRYYGEHMGMSPHEEARGMVEIGEFFCGYREGRDLVVTFVHDRRLVGCTVVDGSMAELPMPLLRWVVVDAEFQRQGLGRMMLHRCVEFCRTRWDRVYLWTVRELPTAVKMYSSAGFEIVEEIVDDRHGSPMHNLRMELRLNPLSGQQIEPVHASGGGSDL